MTRMYITTAAEVEDLAASIATDNNYDEIIDFVLKIDEQVTDLEFTVNLRNALNRVIANEEDSGL